MSATNNADTVATLSQSVLTFGLNNHSAN